MRETFSAKVKEELAGVAGSGRHCRLAELAALLRFCGAVTAGKSGNTIIRISTESPWAAKKVFTLLLKTFSIKADCSVRRSLARQSVSYLVYVHRQQDVVRILQAVKMTGEDTGKVGSVNPVLVMQTCCKRAFLRGAFQAAGSMSDPNKAYHFEIVCPSQELAEQVRILICGFSLDAKTVKRKRSYVVYLKEGDQIVDMLNIMEAHVALMELENVRILKEMRNDVNRKVNCETANINKTVSAAVKQAEDIAYLRDTIGFENLPDGLAEAARARLAAPDATLKELGESMCPPVGKSGMNHRLRRLCELAEKVRQEQGG